jgi:glycosyltransferase involved in cell wall biosynthesis
MGILSKQPPTAKTPHIALFLPDLSGGGAEKVMANLAEGFARRGLRVDMVLVRAEGVYLSHISPGIRLIDLHARSAYTAFPGLIAYLRREKPDALLSTLDLTNLIATLSGRLARSPRRLVIRIANTVSIQHRSPVKKRLERLALSLIYPWADEIVAVSDSAAADFSRYTGMPEERIRTIPNPVISPHLMEKAGQPLGHPWFSPGEIPVVLGVGRLTQQKDFGTLLRAFARLCATRPARLVILGEGEDRSHLERLVIELGLVDDVELPGFIENPYAYLRSAAVFVLSSIWEGLPNSLIEALACGCPVVSTNCPSGPAEILGGGNYGHLVSPGDPESMAEAIGKVLNGDKRQPPRSWLAKYEIETVLDEYLAVLGVEYTPLNFPGRGL